MVTRTFTQIRLEADGAVATITLNRPERLNAFTAVMRRELVAALDLVDGDDEIRVVVVTGEGRAFCAGADLTVSPESDAEPPETMLGDVPRDGGGVVALRLAAMRTPVVGAINGPAVGVGATMLLPMDVRIAADTARFGFVFARRGLVPEATSSWFLPRLVGITQALRWALTGSVFDASEALAGGLVSEVVPADVLQARARAVALELMDGTSAVSVAATRQMMWAMLGEPSPWTAHAIETLTIQALKRGGEAAEGAASFLEKRPPAFPMRLSSDYPTAAPRWPKLPVDLERTVRQAREGSAS